MKVKIQYTTEYEDVPSEVRRLLSSAHLALHAQVALLADLALAPVSLESLSDIDTLRRKLYGVDASLADIDAIVRGYIKLSVEEANRDSPPDKPGDEREDD